MKKIIFFSKNLCIGGMEKSLVALLNQLVNYYEIKLILEEKNGDLLGELNKKIVVEEYKVYNNKNVIFRKIRNVLKRITWIIKNYGQYDFSCNYATYSVIGSHLALKASKNNCIYIHSNYYDMFKGNKNAIKQFFDTILLFRFNNIIFVSNEAEKSILSVFPSLLGKTKVINNVYTPLKLNNDNKAFIPKEKKIILFLGRFDETSKKIERLINAMSIIKQNKDDFYLWLVGDGSDKEFYQELISKLNLENYIKIYPATTNPSSFINNCDALILTSDYEGFPVVFMEAIQFNKPIITTVVVHDEFIDISKYAIVVDRTPESIYEGIIKIKDITINYEFDFKKINEKKVKKFIEIIESGKLE